jgi:radical SAM protein with 4Fe4S-binding SPASM domain
MGADSPFLHLIRLPGADALFHSLTMQVLYGPRGSLQSGPPARHASLFPSSEEEERLVQRWRSDCEGCEVSMATLYLTTECPGECTYCFLRGLDRSPSVMKPAGIDSALDTLDRVCGPGGADLLLYGGEPFLHPELVEYAVREASKRSGVSGIVAITAGWGDHRGLPGLMADRDVFMIVSMDGPPEVNDRCRPGPGGGSSFEAARRAFEVYRKAGCRVGISVTLTEGNLDAMPEAFGWLIDTFSPDDIGLNSALHPNMDGRTPECQVEPGKAMEVMTECLAEARDRGVYVEQLFRRLRPFATGRPRLRDCPAAGSRLVWMPGGRLGFCDCLTARGEGVVPASDPDPAKALGLTRLARECPVFWQGCLDCPSLALCGGGCRYDAWSETGSLSGGSAYRCAGEEVLLRWLLGDLLDVCGGLPPDGSLLLPAPGQRRAMLGGIDPLDPRVVPMPRGTLCGEDAR